MGGGTPQGKPQLLAVPQEPISGQNAAESSSRDYIENILRHPDRITTVPYIIRCKDCCVHNSGRIQTIKQQQQRRQKQPYCSRGTDARVRYTECSITNTKNSFFHVFGQVHTQIYNDPRTQTYIMYTKQWFSNPYQPLFNWIYDRDTMFKQINHLFL